jgi:hypothetical protein
MKQLSVMICLLLTIQAGAQIPGVPKPIQKPAPVLKNNPPDLTVAITEIKSVQLKVDEAAYFIGVDVTITNHSPNSLPKTVLQVEGYVESSSDPDVLAFHKCEYSIPVRTENFVNNTYTTTFYFKKKRLARDRVTTYNFKIKVDSKDNIVESDENNNESEIVSITVDPSIKLAGGRPPGSY